MAWMLRAGGPAGREAGMWPCLSVTRDLPPARGQKQPYRMKSSTCRCPSCPRRIAAVHGAGGSPARPRRARMDRQTDRQAAQALLTLALKLLGGGGEQQLPFHVGGPGAAGDARLLVPGLDPAGEPAQVAAAVQGVGPDGSAGEARAKLGALRAAVPPPTPTSPVLVLKHPEPPSHCREGHFVCHAWKMQGKISQRCSRGTQWGQSSRAGARRWGRRTLCSGEVPGLEEAAAARAGGSGAVQGCGCRRTARRRERQRGRGGEGRGSS